jgi:DHA1 family multidrug/chloramphenicol efflux transport protein-like MFS transporter
MSQPLINITRKHAYVFAFFLVLYEFLTYIANDMIMPGMIKVVESFHGEESAIATSLTAYVLGGASLQLILGPLSDRYGRRPVMIAGALVFFVFTVFIACSGSIEQFLLARFFEGMGLCFIGVVGYATLQEIFAEMDAIRLIALMANMSILAPLLGPLIGATFIHYFSWRYIFVMIGFFSLVALWGLWRFMPETVGQTLRDGRTMTRPPLSLSSVAVNYKKIVCNMRFTLSTLAVAIIGVPCLSWIALSPIILVKDAKLTLIEYGLWQLPVFGAAILGNIILHRLTHYLTLKKLILIGSIIATLSLFAMYFLPAIFGQQYIWLMPGLIVYFLGYGLIGSPLNRYILFSTDVGKGTTSAVISITVMCIGAEGIEIANDVYSTHNNEWFGLYCALIGLAYCIFLICTFFIAENKHPN